MSYKKILIGYVNQSKKSDGEYLSIKNVSDQQIVIEPDQNIFLNKTPKHIKDKYPSTPDFSKSVRVEEQKPEQKEPTTEQIADDIPF